MGRTVPSSGRHAEKPDRRPRSKVARRVNGRANACDTGRKHAARPVAAMVTASNNVCEIRVDVPDSMAHARQTLRGRLTDWDCDNAADIVFVFSELVTNASIHTAGGSRTV